MKHVILEKWHSQNDRCHSAATQIDTFTCLFLDKPEELTSLLFRSLIQLNMVYACGLLQCTIARCHHFRNTLQNHNFFSHKFFVNMAIFEFSENCTYLAFVPIKSLHEMALAQSFERKILVVPTFGLLANCWISQLDSCQQLSISSRSERSC